MLLFHEEDVKNFVLQVCLMLKNYYMIFLKKLSFLFMSFFNWEYLNSSILLFLKILSFLTMLFFHEEDVRASCSTSLISFPFLYFYAIYLQFQYKLVMRMKILFWEPHLELQQTTRQACLHLYHLFMLKVVKELILVFIGLLECLRTYLYTIITKWINGRYWQKSYREGPPLIGHRSIFGETPTPFQPLE